jgi:PIN domain nuclease of toxin-antitoxin system
MNYLLDTHSFIWFISGNAKLRPQARLLMEETALVTRNKPRATITTI